MPPLSWVNKCLGVQFLQPISNHLCNLVMVSLEHKADDDDPPSVGSCVSSNYSVTRTEIAFPTKVNGMW